VNRAIVLLVLAWALSACGTDEEAATSNGDTASVATVNGTVISMDNVARRAEADQTSPRVALNALIDEELLYQFSVTEGFVPSGDRALDLKRLAVHAILRDVVEHEVQPETLDPDVLRTNCEAVAASRTPPALRIASVVSVPYGQESRTAPEAQAIAGRICDRLAAAETIDSLRTTLGGNLPEDVILDDAGNFRENESDTLRGIIYGLQEVGAVSPPFEAGGFMICARLEGIQQSEPVTVDAVEDEVRQDFLRHERTALVVRLAQAAESMHGVRRYEANINRAFALELDTEALP
jgi:hypothetical protein